MKRSVVAARDEVAHNGFVEEVEDLAGILEVEVPALDELRSARTTRMPEEVRAMRERELAVEILQTIKARVQDVMAAPASEEPAQGLDAEVTKILKDAGYDGPDEIRAASDEDLLAVKGIGPKKLDEIRQAVQ